MKESDRKNIVAGNSMRKNWIENYIEDDDIEEMPISDCTPIDYIKTSFLWALYYLKNNYTLNDAIRDIIKKGGDTQANAANAAIVGGLIGASKGINSID
jgi:ADP-ribosylglycohydrolase